MKIFYIGYCIIQSNLSLEIVASDSKRRHGKNLKEPDEGAGSPTYRVVHKKKVKDTQLHLALQVKFIIMWDFKDFCYRIGVLVRQALKSLAVADLSSTA